MSQLAMKASTRAGQIIAAALVLTVITQLAYLGLDASGKSHIAYPIWRIEALAALVIVMMGFGLMRRFVMVGGVLAASGILNLIQIGFGLTMFYQLGYGGEGPPEPTFMPVLGMSFFLYFAAKALIGYAGFVLGRGLSRDTSKGWRLLAGFTALLGLAALLANGAAMVMGMALVFIAGGVGTAATLFAAIVLVRAVHSPSD